MSIPNASPMYKGRTEFYYQQTLEYKCNAGYKYSDGSLSKNITCSEKEKSVTWLGEEFLICTAITCSLTDELLQLKTLLNLAIPSSYTLGQSISVKCPNGSNLTATCTLGASGINGSMNQTGSCNRMKLICEFCTSTGDTIQFRFIVICCLRK